MSTINTPAHYALDELIEVFEDTLAPKWKSEVLSEIKRIAKKYDTTPGHILVLALAPPFYVARPYIARAIHFIVLRR